MRRTLPAVIAAVMGLTLWLPAAAQESDQPPTCGESGTTRLWPPNHKFKTVALPTATDPEGGTLTASAPSVFQDEPVDARGNGDGNTKPDARILEDGALQVRSERAGRGDGRFYHVSVTFTDAAGNTVTCESLVVVPHDRGRRNVPGDQGPLFNSFGS